MGFLKLFKQSTNLQIQGFYFTANLLEKKNKENYIWTIQDSKVAG